MIGLDAQVLHHHGRVFGGIYYFVMRLIYFWLYFNVFHLNQ